MAANTKLYSFIKKNGRVTLTCGCIIPVRERPKNANTRYMCIYGKGHGYSLYWIAFEDVVTDYKLEN